MGEWGEGVELALGRAAQNPMVRGRSGDVADGPAGGRKRL